MIIFIPQNLNYYLHIIWSGGLWWNDLFQGQNFTISGIWASNLWRGISIWTWKIWNEFSEFMKSMYIIFKSFSLGWFFHSSDFFILKIQFLLEIFNTTFMCDTGDLCMSLGATKFFLCNFFVCNRLDNVWTGDEHVWWVLKTYVIEWRLEFTAY